MRSTRVAGRTARTDTVTMTHRKRRYTITRISPRGVAVLASEALWLGLPCTAVLAVNYLVRRMIRP
mgnify:CR=1 FL=1